MRKLLTTIALLMAAVAARAQFYDTGADPSYLKWFSVDTKHYRIIYPQGADSLAFTYGTLLERYGAQTGKSIGLEPSGKLPVVLHTLHPYSNGSVSWAPSRMDLYTLPQPYGPDPATWPVQLASHEPRHQAQLHFAGKGWWKAGTWLIGESFNPLAWVLYMDRPFGEGDAVAAETGLTTYGTRARTADFLNYYRLSFDQGDVRTWNRWRYGSFKHYTPDVYTIGYMTVAGERVFGGNPYAMRDAMVLTRKKPWRYSPYNLGTHKNWQRTVEGFSRIWKEQTERRGPFMAQERISAEEDFPVEYSGPIAVKGTLYAIREGYTHTAELVKCDAPGGAWESVIPFGSHTSALFDSPAGRIYWSETIPSPRWEHDGKSIIRYYDTLTGKVVDLTSSGRYYNPSPSADEKKVVVDDYPAEGGASLLVLDSSDGTVLERYAAPTGLQPTESAWGEGDKEIYTIGITDEGISIYKVSQEGWERVFRPVQYKISSIWYQKGVLEWTADNSGENELYRYDIESRRLTQITSLRYGGRDFCADGDYYLYVSQVRDGYAVFRSHINELQHREVPLHQWVRYEVEDSLSAQEKAIGAVVDNDLPVEFSPARRYHKLSHALRIHSWAPLYINYDEIKSGSFDIGYESLWLGATAFFQNTLGTLYGSLGYCFDNSLHAKLVYKGLYPVIEASYDLGGEKASLYSVTQMSSFGSTVMQIGSSPLGAPLSVASLQAYIPLKFNKGGLLKGVIPRVRYSLSNSFINTSPMLYEAPVAVFGEFPAWYHFQGWGQGRVTLMQSLSASLRAYAMLPQAESRAYPKFGAGAEVGYSIRPGMSDVFSPNVYGYLYGYLPGFYQSHGIKLSVLAQARLGNAPFGENTVNTAPRGFGRPQSRAMASLSRGQVKLSADYGMPVYLGDISLMPLCYIRNFMLTPNVDFTYMGKGNNLYSVGMDVAADLANIAFLCFDTSLGISVSYLGGTMLDAVGQEGRWSVGPVFEMKF